MKLVIETVQNGIRLYEIGRTDEEGFPLVDEVYQFDEYAADELDTVRDLLYSIREHLGYSGSKHDPRRLFIEIEVQGNE